ncbi:hypothetical protein GCM10022221_43600 [Actinocorallia aurea]
MPIRGTVRRPHPGLPAREVRDDRAQAIWLVGCHGGAGATTLASLLGMRDAGRCWPVPQTGRANVVLVAHPDAPGMRAVHVAARQHAEHPALRNGINLLGLVLNSWAPGRLPRDLRQLRESLGAAVPHVWEVEYIGALRLGRQPSEVGRLPRSLRLLRRDLVNEGWVSSLQSINREGV